LHCFINWISFAIGTPTSLKNEKASFTLIELRQLYLFFSTAFAGKSVIIKSRKKTGKAGIK
jgi:hypothetical protein